MNKSNKLASKACERAMRMVQEHRGEYLWATVESMTSKWKTMEAVGLATLEWVAWLNHHRLLGSIGYIPPAETEANYYRQTCQSGSRRGGLT
jgi:hypothetical protein